LTDGADRGGIDVERVRVSKDGSLKIPRSIVRSLGIPALADVELRPRDDGTLEFVVQPHDPFEAGPQKPADDSFEKLVAEEDTRAEKADRKFRELMENPPEVRPEDRPDFWD